jgi:four helix bundle protein
MDPLSLPRRVPYDICERTFQFACVVVGFCRDLNRLGWIQRHIANQLLRSGTGVGANVQEAQAPSSKREFAFKTGVALRESRETQFWLRLIVACDLAPGANTEVVLAEAGELTAILTTMVKRTRTLRT